jgi:hypothetical protein
MAKFKVNQKVIRKSDGNVGTVKAREVISENKRTDVKYLVDFGDGLENWKVMRRGELKNYYVGTKPSRYVIKSYEVGDGRIVTLAALVETFKNDMVFDNPFKTKVLSIGYTIYNGTDEYNERIGHRFAIHRCKQAPFTMMFSPFGGDFNADTVDAIMKAKADYIIRNIEKFVS